MTHFVQILQPRLRNCQCTWSHRWSDHCCVAWCLMRAVNLISTKATGTHLHNVDIWFTSHLCVCQRRWWFRLYEKKETCYILCICIRSHIHAHKKLSWRDKNCNPLNQIRDSMLQDMHLAILQSLPITFFGGCFRRKPFVGCGTDSIDKIADGKPIKCNWVKWNYNWNICHDLPRRINAWANPLEDSIPFITQECVRSSLQSGENFFLSGLSPDNWLEWSYRAWAWRRGGAAVKDLYDTKAISYYVGTFGFLASSKPFVQGPANLIR